MAKTRGGFLAKNYGVLSNPLQCSPTLWNVLECSRVLSNVLGRSRTFSNALEGSRGVVSPPPSVSLAIYLRPRLPEPEAAKKTQAMETAPRRKTAVMMLVRGMKGR